MPHTTKRLGDDFSVVGYRLSRQLSDNEKRELMDHIREITTPLPDRQIASLYAQACLLTSRGKTELSANEASKVMVAYLRNYPGQLVKEALEGWHRQSRFFPTVSDIVAIIQPETDALMDLIYQVQNPTPWIK